MNIIIHKFPKMIHIIRYIFFGLLTTLINIGSKTKSLKEINKEMLVNSLSLKTQN